MAIVKFEPELQEGALAPGFVLKRGTFLRSQKGKAERTACTFTTAHDVRLLPLEILEGRYFIRDVAELNLPLRPRPSDKQGQASRSPARATASTHSAAAPGHWQPETNGAAPRRRLPRLVIYAHTPLTLPRTFVR